MFGTGPFSNVGTLMTLTDLDIHLHNSNSTTNARAGNGIVDIQLISKIAALDTDEVLPLLEIDESLSSKYE